MRCLLFLIGAWAASGVHFYLRTLPYFSEQSVYFDEGFSIKDVIFLPLGIIHWAGGVAFLAAVPIFSFVSLDCGNILVTIVGALSLLFWFVVLMSMRKS